MPSYTFSLGYMFWRKGTGNETNLISIFYDLMQGLEISPPPPCEVIVVLWFIVEYFSLFTLDSTSRTVFGYVYRRKLVSFI